MGKLTAAGLSKLSDGKYTDGDGLIYCVRGTSRTFVFRYQEDGKRHDKGLGAIPLSAARRRVAKYRAWQADGHRVRDFPGDQPQREQKKHLFKDIYRKAIDNYANLKRWKNEKTLPQWITSITTYALPVLGDKAVEDIRREDILAVLSPIWHTKTETASRVRSRLQSIFDYCHVRGWRDSENPARWGGNLDMFLPAPETIKPVRHHSATPWRDLPSLCDRLAGSGAVSCKAILFGILTAARAGEFTMARWNEIDMEARIWSVPPERRKDKQPFPHRVPLPDQAVDILQTLERSGDPEGFVFCWHRGCRISQETPRIVLQKLTGEKWTMHGMRSSFRDWAAENGEDWVASEKALSHAVGSAVAQSYLRSDMLEERRGIMQRWADYLLPRN